MLAIRTNRQKCFFSVKKSTCINKFSIVCSAKLLVHRKVSLKWTFYQHYKLCAGIRYLVARFFLKGLTKADLHSVPTPLTRTTVWSQQARKERNTVNHTWVTDDVSTTVMTKQTFLMTSNAIDYRENINTLKTTSINQINRQRNEGKKP